MDRDREYKESDLIDSLKENKFDRNPLINDFIKMLNTVEYNTCFSLDGEWGSGKTVFVKEIEFLNKSEFQKYQKIDSEVIEKFKEKYMVFYYNAWENDYHGDPLQSLLVSLLSKQKLSEKAINNIKKALITIFSENFIEFIKNKSGGLIDIKKIKESDSDKYCFEIMTIEKRKELVSNIMNELREEKKLLVILDELDRCSPTFAVRLLETVKHYFNNDNVIFLISTHNSKLAYTVEKFYGNKFDGESYLDKFYDLKINLPEINKEQFTESKRYCIEFYEFVNYFGMSLREINHYNSMLEVCNVDQFTNNYRYRFSKEKVDMLKDLIAFGIALKTKKPNEFINFINNDINDPYLSYLEFSKNNNTFRNGSYDKYIETYKILKNDENASGIVKKATYLMYLFNPIDKLSESFQSISDIKTK